MVAVDRQDAAPLLVQAHELTVVDWNRCHDAGGRALKLSQPDPDRTYPATGLS